MAHDLSKDQIATLLDRLSGDKSFHADFASDPARALGSIGLPTTLAACMVGRKLAPMDTIAGARKDLSDLFSDTTTLAQSVHHLAAN